MFVHVRESPFVELAKWEENLHKSPAIYHRKKRFYLRILLISFHLLNFTLDGRTRFFAILLGTISCRRITNMKHTPLAKLLLSAAAFPETTASPVLENHPPTRYAVLSFRYRHSSTTRGGPRFSSTSSLIELESPDFFYAWRNFIVRWRDSVATPSNDNFLSVAW